MAVNLNSHEVFKANKKAYGFFFNKYKFLNFFFINFFLSKVKLINYIKKVLQFFHNYFNFFRKKKNLDLSINSTDLATYKSLLTANDWIFIENFLDVESYKNIIDNWPPDYYFYLSNSVEF